MAYSVYGHEDDPSYGPANIGDPIKLDPLAGINEKRPKFRSRRQQEKAERYAQALEQDASSTAPLGHWTQALAQVGKGIRGGLEEREIDQNDAQRRDYLAAALEGDQSPQDLMEQGALYDVPELSDIGKYRSEQDWRKQQAATEEGWKQKGYDLQKEDNDLARKKFAWEQTKPAEGSVPKITDVTTMRKEIQDMDSTRLYSAAIPAFNTMMKAGPGKPGDLTMVYSLAKLYDPGGVVMEGDKKSIAANASLPESVWGYLSALGGGSEFGPELRAKIVAEARAKAESLKSAYEANLEPYRYIAKNYGIDEKLIIPQFEDYAAGYRIIGSE